jgi:formate hydrogenlyase subunit 6/NADH:ubiquinone oxidoreductase subunit I/intein/homing endonuclease
MTMRYPDVQTEMQSYYTYDPKLGVAKPGYKGRHILWLDKCTGCQLCSIACENISQAIEMVKVNRTQPNNKKSIFPQVDYAKCVFCGFCIDPSTPVMMNPGVRTIQQIEIGDRVLTHAGEYKPVTKVWNMHYAGPLYRIYVFGKPEPLVCTGDHPILAVSRTMSKRKDRRLFRIEKPIDFYKPQQLKVGDHMLSPIVRKEIEIETYSEVSLYKGGKVKKLLELRTSHDLFRLIGYYLSEGFCDGERTVRFAFHRKQVNLVSDCAALLHKFFKKSVVLKKNGANGIIVVLHSGIAERFFSQFGLGAENKKLPDWVFFAPRGKQVDLIKGIWLGDGCRITQPRQNYLNITTTSQTLAFQIQQVLARMGVVVTLERMTNKHKQPAYHIDAFGRWAQKLSELMRMDFGFERTKRADKFLLNESFVFMPIRKIEVEEVKDRHVMDVTVENDHTFAPLGLVTSNCVDACPFYALGMTEDFNLVSTSKKDLVYSPEKLAVPPKIVRPKVEFKIQKDVAFHD